MRAGFVSFVEPGLTGADWVCDSGWNDDGDGKGNGRWIEDDDAQCGESNKISLVPRWILATVDAFFHESSIQADPFVSRLGLQIPAIPERAPQICALFPFAIHIYARPAFEICIRDKTAFGIRILARFAIRIRARSAFALGNLVFAWLASIAIYETLLSCTTFVKIWSIRYAWRRIWIWIVGNVRVWGSGRGQGRWRLRISQRVGQGGGVLKRCKVTKTFEKIGNCEK